MQPTREEGHRKRSQRLAKLKRGPGTFVYDGKGFDVHYHPTVLRTGKKEPVMDAEGLPVVDAAGRQVFQKAGVPVLDDVGKPKMGGPPKIVNNPIDVYEIRGVKFPAGKPVVVNDHALALKLRCLHVFDEVEAGAVPVSVVADDKKALADMSKAELLAAAEEAGLSGSGKSKAELIELLESETAHD